MAQDGGEDEDYFAHFEDLEFTEEDLARIDRVCEGDFYAPVPEPEVVLPESKGEALVAIEVEKEFQAVLEVISPPTSSPHSPMSEPPYHAFRSGKSLSVSDLTGPLWCELQYEYRQRQGWGLKVKDRPQTFVSREGNTIVASHSIASNNDNILKAGRVVHRRLEREIRPPQVRVDVETLEEYWATRLIDMLDCLMDLAKHGFCREMPVFGLTHDHTISGIIDEISISVQKPTDDGPVINDRAIERTMHVSDTKTRDVPTIPPERNSTQARTQLMLYHRLLSALIKSSSALEPKPHHLDFDLFWFQMGVDPYEPFSDGFCEQTGLSSCDAVSHTLDQKMSSTGNEEAKRTQFCLNTLVDIWKNSLRLLGITSVDPTLTLNYRRRAISGRKKRRRTKDGKGRAMESQEEKELNQAIVASLAQAEHEDPALAYAIAESLRDAQVTGNPVLEQTSPQQTGLPPKRDTGSDPDEADLKPDNRVDEEEGRGSELIGSTSFVMDDAALDARLEKVLEWWLGIRRPEGVDLEDTGRCHTCEFSASCEWREKKSNELLSKLQLRARDAS